VLYKIWWILFSKKEREGEDLVVGKEEEEEASGLVFVFYCYSFVF
jgi:hypothetical protein